MPRVKGGYVTRRRRKAVLKLAKGYYGSILYMLDFGAADVVDCAAS